MNFFKKQRWNSLNIEYEIVKNCFKKQDDL